MSQDSWDRALVRLTSAGGGTETRAYMAVPGRWAIVVLDTDGRPFKVIASFGEFNAAEEFARENYPKHAIVPSAAVIPSRTAE